MSKTDQIVTLEKKKAYFTARLEQATRHEARIVLLAAVEDVKNQLRQLGVKGND